MLNELIYVDPLIYRRLLSQAGLSGGLRYQLMPPTGVAAAIYAASGSSTVAQACG